MVVRLAGDHTTVRVHRRSSHESPCFDVSFVIGAGEILTTPTIPGFALGLTVLFDRRARTCRPGLPAPLSFDGHLIGP